MRWARWWFSKDAEFRRALREKCAAYLAPAGEAAAGEHAVLLADLELAIESIERLADASPSPRDSKIRSLRNSIRLLGVVALSTPPAPPPIRRGRRQGAQLPPLRVRAALPRRRVQDGERPPPPPLELADVSVIDTDIDDHQNEPINESPKARPALSRALADGDYDKLVDERLDGDYNKTEAARVAACAAACIRHAARRRPKMSQVVKSLQGEVSLETLNDGPRDGTLSSVGSMPVSDYGRSGSSSTYTVQTERIRKVALPSPEYSTEYPSPSPSPSPGFDHPSPPSSLDTNVSSSAEHVPVTNHRHRAGRLHGDHHAQLLRRQRARHAPAQLLFRVGGVAALLSTSPVNARFRLKHVVRTFTGASDDGAYRCVFQEEDDQGNVGINLTKNLMAVAGSSMKHLCIHAGGRAVIDQLQKKFGLSDEQVEASRMTLHRFGNTSSSSLWYELAYVEQRGDAGQRALGVPTGDCALVGKIAAPRIWGGGAPRSRGRRAGDAGRGRRAWVPSTARSSTGALPPDLA
ncbi:hypothetical protein ZWY2020_024155 [Hordeum vulgare]|nr:hypothetical protein ZWY2020_024155 [Hordeum vulgare]